ncbi:AraC family transcriptional regulator [Streptomyces sp. NPDC090994]|uniref:AraC family transcriptional regulator n=1 Tax=Streptomyces sp. NPDC090994 TaxID=3365969 RepID=UPI00380270D8
MDVFGDMFRSVRAQGSLFGSSTVTAPWALRFVDGAPLTLCTVLEGSGWILPEGLPPEHLTAGETLILRGPAPFSFVDEIGTAAEPIECGESCATPDQGGTRHRLGWHDAAPGDSEHATTLVTGAYPVRGEIGRQLLDAVPDVLRIAGDGTVDAVRALLAAEVAVDAPGQQIVLDRLLDWMLVCSLRDWFDRPGGNPPAWYTAHRDPVVGHALKLLHEQPAAPWTVSSLARRAGVSRATFAKRFADLVGEPPLTFLTRRRMMIAADLMRERRTATLAEIAHEVGYSDAFGFSAAFKRVRGVNPTEFRRELV